MRTQRESHRELADVLPRSAALWRDARAAIAGGTSHDAWQADPFPTFSVRGHRGRKWDADGRELIDFWMGHGALLCGHSWSPVLRAVRAQLGRGTHLGPHPLEARWAHEVRRLVPSAERVRFTSSGSEAVSLALRVARAVTGRSRIARIAGHFHGWHDGALAGLLGPTGGIPTQAARLVSVLPDGDAAAAHRVLSTRRIAGLILEPGGGSAGALPSDPAYVRALRALTTSTGTLLIFDEVITGFRTAPGGAQALLGVTPDLTVLAKILCGGLPGGALAGSAKVMAIFDEGALAHTGTFNANPLSAAAGVACLEQLGDGRAQRRAAARAAALVTAVNQRAAHAGVDVQLFATHSVFHVLIGGQRSGVRAAPSRQALELQLRQRDAHDRLRRMLAREGVDAHPVHGWVSASHTSRDIETAAAAYGRAFERWSRGSEGR